MQHHKEPRWLAGFVTFPKGNFHIDYANKLLEDKQVIENNLNFLQKYCLNAPNILSDTIELMSKVNSYKRSFDIYHICYSQFYECDELITFDKEFQRFKEFLT